MGLLNCIKSVLIHDKEMNAIKSAYKSFFNFCKEYGYEPTNIQEIKIEDNFHTSTSIFTNSGRVQYHYNKVVRFLLVYIRNADLVTLCTKFKGTTGQALYIPSEITESQYIALCGWRYYQSIGNKYYKSNIIFGFGDEWHLPICRNGEIKYGYSFSEGGLREEICYSTPKEHIINLYNSFILATTEDLINKIKWYNQDSVTYCNCNWYIKKMHNKYKDKIPILCKGENTGKNNLKMQCKKEIKTKAIEQSWSLLEFAKINGRVSIGDLIDRTTGKQRRGLAFTDNNDNKIYVDFAAELGVLIPSEIKEKKYQLRIGKLSNGNYVLYE